MGLLQSLRRNNLVNTFFRKTLKATSALSTGFHTYVINRWAPAGILDCTFNEYKFRYFSKGDDGLPHYFYYGLPYPESGDLIVFLELARKSQTIVDIGANTGLFSVLSSLANPSAKILSIEPYSVNAERLKLNLDINTAINVTVFELAIGDMEGEIEIAVPKDHSVTDVSSVNQSFSKSIYPQFAWDSQKVRISTLDHFIAENKVLPDLIKCDVETFEMAVFRGMDRILTDVRPTIIFECFLDEERRLFFDEILRKYKYYVYLILSEGIVHTPEGFVKTDEGLNYLITPVKPVSAFISNKDPEKMCNELLKSRA